MRFFSKLVFICNMCFIIAAILRLVEMANKQNTQFNGVIKLQPLQSTLVILGYGAIFINLIFLIACILMWMNPKRKPFLNWVVIVNLIMFPIQVYYYFFSNF